MPIDPEDVAVCLAPDHGTDPRRPSSGRNPTVEAAERKLAALERLEHPRIATMESAVLYSALTTSTARTRTCAWAISWPGSGRS